MVRKKTRVIADAQPSFALIWHAWRNHTSCTALVGRRCSSGTVSHPVARWDLRVTRGELSGRSTDDVLRLLIDSLLHHLDGQPSPSDWYNVPADSSAVGPGGPLGGPRGEWYQPRLPGLRLRLP